VEQWRADTRRTVTPWDRHGWGFVTPWDRRHLAGLPFRANVSVLTNTVGATVGRRDAGGPRGLRTRDRAGETPAVPGGYAADDTTL